MSSLDAALADLAARRHGAFTTSQALGLGFTGQQIRRRVEAGRWERRMRGVLVVAGSPESHRQALHVVQLARPTAAFSHQTAAHLLGPADQRPPLPDITVAPGTSPRTPLATVHRHELPASQRTIVDGLTVTTAPRMLVDCATLLGPVRLGRLVDATFHRLRVSAAEVQAVASTAAHLTDRRREVLLQALEVWTPAIRPGSAAEARFLRHVAEWGLPEPERQVQIVDEEGRVIARCDAGWSDRRIALEYDSVEWHGPAAWADDEARHEAITALGWELIHVDKADLVPGRRDLRDRLVRAYRRKLPVEPSPQLHRRSA